MRAILPHYRGVARTAQNDERMAMSGVVVIQSEKRSGFFMTFLVVSWANLLTWISSRFDCKRWKSTQFLDAKAVRSINQSLNSSYSSVNPS